jgi:hypothetical protein
VNKRVKVLEKEDKFVITRYARRRLVILEIVPVVKVRTREIKKFIPSTAIL